MGICSKGKEIGKLLKCGTGLGGQSRYLRQWVLGIGRRHSPTGNLRQLKYRFEMQFSDGKTLS